MDVGTAEMLSALPAEIETWSEEDAIFGTLALLNITGVQDTTSRMWERAVGRLELTARDAYAPPLEVHTIIGSFRTGTRSTALTLLLGARIAPTDPIVDLLVHGLVRLRTDGHWRTTHDDALSLLALAEYQKTRSGVSDGPMTAIVLLDEKQLATQRFTPSSLASFRKSLPVGDLSGAGSLRFQVDGEGSVYYTGTMRWEESAVRRSPREGGLALARRIEPLDGQGPVSVGDPVVVIHEVVVERACAFLALRDPLPAGLEAIQHRFRPESRALTRSFAGLPTAFRWLPVTHQEIRDKEVRAFTGPVQPGIYEFRYLARVRSAGSFVHPPATIEAMYEPELTAATGSGRFIVPPLNGP